jgi:hypothetical protein
VLNRSDTSPQYGIIITQTFVSVSPHFSCKFHFTLTYKIMNSAPAYDLVYMTFARILRFYFWFINKPLFPPTDYYRTDEKRYVYVTETTD